METKQEYLKRLLPLLKKPIPYQWRVQSYSSNKPQATVMAYIDVRDVQDVLDAYCVYGWHRKHQMLDGRLYCSIGIEMPDGTIQWREDCGTESNTEKEKGQASDSCKRSAVNWGIGRFLYDMKIQYVTTDVKKAQGNYPKCIDEQGKTIYDLTTYINNKNPNAPQAPQTPVDVPEPSVADKASQMGKVPIALTQTEITEHKVAIDKITSAEGLAGYYKSLTADVQANKEIIDYLGAQRKKLTPKA